MQGEVHRRYPLSGIWADRVSTCVLWLLGGLGLSLPLFIIGFLIIGGFGVVSWEFVSDGPKGFPLGLAGGIWPAIQGSLALICIALLVSLPIAVASAIYLAEYCGRPRLITSARLLMEGFAGVPSMVYGLFGYSLLVIILDLRVSLLSGGITLGLMMVPQILIGTHEGLKSVENVYRDAGLSLGITRAYLVRRIVLRQAWPRILAITMLASGHAMGAAAPVLYTASVIHSRGGVSLGAPVMTLPTHLYYLVSEAVSFEHAYGTALVLVSILLCANFLAVFINRMVKS